MPSSLPRSIRTAVALASLATVAGLVPTAARAAATPPASNEAAPTLATLQHEIEALIAQNRLLADKVARLEARQAPAGAASTSAPNPTLAGSVRTAGMPPAPAPAAPSSPAPAQATSQVAAQAAEARELAQAAQQTAAAAAEQSRQAGWAATTTINAYGEIGYSRPSKQVASSSTDVQRAVIGMQHRFDDRTRMAAEWEWEHAIVSSSDQGESEVEQLWVERDFDSGVRGRAGLFLMPVGLLNQNHEPTAYYGVFRPDVDTRIIPSTWREVGIGASGDFGNGLDWDIALTTAPNLAHWDASTTEGRARGPLQAIHGEGQFAASRTFGGVAALNWRGVPGLWIGGSLTYDDIGQGQPGFAGSGARLVLADAHARYQVAGWDFAAEAVHGTITGADALNTSFLASDIPSPTLVPHEFYGAYAQAAYQVLKRGDYTLTPFVRYEILNTAAGFDGLPGSARQPAEHVLTMGTSLFIGDGVVLKADYRDYRHQKQPDPQNHWALGNSLNLGLGFAF